MTSDVTDRTAPPSACVYKCSCCQCSCLTLFHWTVAAGSPRIVESGCVAAARGDRSPPCRRSDFLTAIGACRCLINPRLGWRHAEALIASGAKHYRKPPTAGFADRRPLPARADRARADRSDLEME